MIKENKWDNEFHEDLFKLFILASNDFCVTNFDDESARATLDYAIERFNQFQFNDRAVCEERREFKVVCRDYSDTGSEYRSRLVLSHKSPLGPAVYSGDTIIIETVK